MPNIAIVGAGGTGKDTICDYLTSQLGFEKVVNYTTRPMRDGEKEGKSYHFISEQSFKDIVEMGLFATVASYWATGQDKPWFYGSPVLTDDENHNQVIILNPEGVSKHEKELSGVIYLYAMKEVRHRRMINRGDSSPEAWRRACIDEEVFAGYKREYQKGASNLILDTAASWTDTKACIREWLVKLGFDLPSATL